MNFLKRELKRARPALGTILLLRLEAPASLADATIDEVLTRAFDLAEELENRFSKLRLVRTEAMRVGYRSQIHVLATERTWQNSQPI